MAMADLPTAAQRRINGAVRHFENNRYRFDIVADGLVNCLSKDPLLTQRIHFIKHRVKDPKSLTDKLVRLAESEPPIDANNLFDSVNDLVGVRLIHLHSDQLVAMHPRILEILHDNQYRIVGHPVAYCWDDEYDRLFQDVGLRTERATSMYTTVHYDVQANQRSPITCELQVRSLTDEVWGEVSHRVNYPTESPSEACRDQLKVLARLTSGCGRLVDSIFKTHGQATTANEP